MLLVGTAGTYLDPIGLDQPDGTFFLMFNAHSEPVSFRLPTFGAVRHWTVRLDTSRPDEPDGTRRVAADAVFPVPQRSLQILQRLDDGGAP